MNIVSFRDTLGTEWKLNLTLGKAMEIEAYDFQGRCEKVQLIPVSEDFFTKRILDVKVCFGIAWVLVRDLCLSRKWSNPYFDPSLPESDTNQRFSHIENENDFAARFDGKTVEDMKKAVWEVLPAFFPEAEASLKILMKRYSRVDQRMREKATAMIETQLTDERMDQLVDKTMKEMEQEIERNFALELGEKSSDGPENLE